VLGLWLRRLEWAGKNDDLGIVNLFLHLGMRKVLVNNDTLNERGVLDGSAGLGDDLDEVKVHILPLDVGDVEHGLDGEISEVVLTLAHDLGAEGCGSALSQELVVILCNVQLFSDVVYLICCNVASAFESIGDFERVDTLVKELLCLLEDSTSENDDSGGSVSNFVIL